VSQKQCCQKKVNGKNVPNHEKIFQLAKKHLKYLKRALNINTFHSTALQNIPKSGFLVYKYTTWQPCSKDWNTGIHAADHQPDVDLVPRNRPQDRKFGAFDVQTQEIDCCNSSCGQNAEKYFTLKYWPGVDVIICNCCDFSPTSGKKMGVFP
jgi:hypothetical protein